MIMMATAMNAGGGNRRQLWWRHDLNGQRRWQHNGWRDGSAITMVMGDGREMATQWKTVMAAAQLQWAMATVAQWMALYLDELLSPSKINDRLNVIPWRHGTHGKVWDTSTITSLRKVEVEEEVEEKVEVQVEVWRRKSRRRRGDKGACTNSYEVTRNTYLSPLSLGTCPQTMVSNY